MAVLDGREPSWQRQLDLFTKPTRRLHVSTPCQLLHIMRTIFVHLALRSILYLQFKSQEVDLSFHLEEKIALVLHFEKVALPFSEMRRRPALSTCEGGGYPHHVQE